MTEPPAARTFDFARDTFAFRNELYWEYRVDEKTGRVSTRKNVPAPSYAHRCFVVARSARQFFFHARFDASLPPCPAETYRGLVRAVVRRSDSTASAEGDRLAIPGFADLRAFSRAHEGLLKENCGGAWQSYFNRGHWRMVFPFSRPHQAREAERLAAGIKRGAAPIIHIVRFPELTINHALLLFGAARHERGIDFALYDPNLPEAPSTLQYSASERTFLLPRNIYWGGGRVDVYETYRA